MAAEKQFETRIKDFLKSRDAYFVKFFANAYTRRGVPDILACVNGVFVGIEVKAQRGRPSELQMYNIREINEAGGYAFILYPSAFAEFQKFIDRLKIDGESYNEIPEIWK